MSDMIKNIVVALKGFAMGAANVIPGVSGGTIALLTGIFEKLVGSLNALMDIASWKLLFKGKFKEWNEYVNGTFLLWLAIGVLVSVFTLAKLMEYVLHFYPIQTWAFFFGLIVVSSIFLLRDIGKWDFKAVVFLLAGVALGVVICTLSPTETTDSLWFIALCGAIAICTMILPGISGSFILVILGKYDFIMRAIGDLDIPVLAMFGLGCVLGILAFSKFLHWLLSKFETPTLLVLIGFTLGSLVKVWPWSDKVSALAAQMAHGGMTLEAAEAASEAMIATGADFSNMIHPQVGGALAWFAVGAVFVFAIEWLGSRQKEK